MHHWLESAKVLALKLEKRSETLDDIELKLDIQSVAGLIRRAEIEMTGDSLALLPSLVGQSGNVSRILHLDEIAYCQSDDKKVFVTDSDYKVYRTSKTLKDIEADFPSLIRINQSTLIHKSQICSMELNDRLGYYAIRLNSKSIFKVSRRCYRNVKDFFKRSSEDEFKKVS